MKKYNIILTLAVILSSLSCKHVPSEAEFIEGLNKYPTTFPNMESDVYYFQKNNLIQFDHVKQIETNILTTKAEPYSVQCSGNRNYIFYADNAWISGTLMRFDIATKKEIEFRKNTSGFYASYDGEKVLSGENYYNHITGAEKNIGSIYAQTIQTINDSTIIAWFYTTRWDTGNIIKTELMSYKRINDSDGYRLPDRLVYSAVENDTFRVLSIVDEPQLSSEWTYNKDSSYAYSIKNIGGFPRGYILNDKTGEQKQILAEEGRHLMWSMDFSPSGKQLVYSLYLSNASNLMNYVFVANADGSSPALISSKKISSMRAVFVSK